MGNAAVVAEIDVGQRYQCGESAEARAAGDRRMPGPERVIVLFGGSEDYPKLTSRRPGPPPHKLAEKLPRPVFFLGAAAGRDDQQSSVFEAVCAEPGARPCDGVRLQPERRLRAGRRADTGEVVIQIGRASCRD